MNGKIYNIFPTTVGIYQSDNIDHSKITHFLEELYSKYTQDNEVSKNYIVKSFYQTGSGLDRLDLLSNINNFVKKSVISYMKDCCYDFDDEDLYIADCWANVSTGVVSTHTPHTHSNSFISAVYYAAAPENSGELYFLHPCMQVNSVDPDHKSSTMENSTEFSIKPEEGMCVIFKSSTIHGTSSNYLNNTNRISIAYTFNLRNLGKKSLFSHYEKF